LGAIVRHELGKIFGKKPSVKNGNDKISSTLGRLLGS
jgi:hypothetical protein